MSDSMRILVLGGTGFIGPNLVRELRAHELTLFHRHGVAPSLRNVSHIYGDRADLAQFRASFERLRFDVIVDMMAQNETSARLATDVLASFSGRLVMISSASVYRQYGKLLRREPGPMVNVPATEDASLRSALFPYRHDPRRGADDPSRWLDDYDKIPAEATYLAHRSASVCVVRLPMVWGPGDPDERVGQYVRLMRAGLAEIRLGESVASWRNARGYVENVASAVALVATSGRGGCVYNVADPGDLTEREWIECIARAAEWKGNVTTVPDSDPVGLKPLSELPARANFAQHLLLDTHRIRSELGYREPVPLEAALRRTVGSGPPQG
jgi:nucleoside-diphosphate-sugar epimerase